MGALRSLVYGGAPVRELLVRGRGRFGREESVAAAVLAALPAVHEPLPEPLTPPVTAAPGRAAVDAH